MKYFSKKEEMDREWYRRMGGTGNLPVPPGYQPGGMAAARFRPNCTFLSTECRSLSGRQVADLNRLVACSTLSQRRAAKYPG